MKILIKISKYLNNNYIFICAVFLPLILLVIAADIFIQYLVKLDMSILYNISLNFGKAGIITALISFMFFPVRKLFVFLKKNNSSGKYGFLQSVSIIMANIHPVLSFISLLLLLNHAYLFFVVIYGLTFSPVIIFGLASLIGLIILFITGTIIKRNMSNKTVRKIHFTILFAFLLFFIMHRAFTG